MPPQRTGKQLHHQPYYGDVHYQSRVDRAKQRNRFAASAGGKSSVPHGYGWTAKHGVHPIAQPSPSYRTYTVPPWRKSARAPLRPVARTYSSQMPGYKRWGGMGGRAYRSPYNPFAGAARRLGPAYTGRIPPGELKFKDTANTGIAIAAVAAMTGLEQNPNLAGANDATCVNALTQGTGDQQRIGREVRQMSLHFKGVVTVQAQTDQTDMDTSPSITIWIVLDKQSNGAAASSEEIVTNVSASISLGPESDLNLRFKQRFTVLKKIKVRLPLMTAHYDGNLAAINQPGIHKNWNADISLGGMRVTYSASDAQAGFAEMPSNAVNVIASCSSTTLVPLLRYNCRMRYRDS